MESYVLFIAFQPPSYHFPARRELNLTSSCSCRYRTLTTMFGKQYRFNPTRSQPPHYWVIEKYHKYQQTIRNDLGQRVVETRERLLDVFVIVERKVMKCSTLFDLANVRVVSTPFTIPSHLLSQTVSPLLHLTSSAPCIPSPPPSTGYAQTSRPRT